MRKILIVVITLIIAGCSKGDDTTPMDGQYVFSDDYITIALQLESGICNEVIIYSLGNYEPLEFPTTYTQGSYPNYSYQVDSFKIEAKFNNDYSFNSSMNGHVNIYYIKDNGTSYQGGLTIDAPSADFVLDNTPLDADNDGVLDSYI